MNRPTTLFAASALLLFACDGATLDDDAGPDPTTDAGPATACSSHAECDDGVFCNGVETCAPGAAGADDRGCVDGAAPCSVGETCREATAACERCEGPADADGDGEASIACGGADCDDTNAAVFPGATEVCDAEGVDEDCDPETLSGSDGDVDSDGFVAMGCCNVQRGGGMRCGRDCDDAVASTNPDAIEVCNGVDDDCDTERDEGVSAAVFRDADNDGFGDPDDTMVACFSSVPEGYRTTAGDCDDTSVQRFPGAPERCDGEDDDCDGRTDENALEIGTRDHCSACGDGCQFACLGAATGCDLPVELALTTDNERGGASCARLESGAAYCWGANFAGQLGNGTNVPSEIPTRVATARLDGIAAGHQHVCGVGPLGVFCWGAGSAGQLGTGDRVARAVPTVASPRAAAPIGAGRNHTCVYEGVDGGSFGCAGSNGYLQLGEPSSVPELLAFSGSALSDLDELVEVGGGDFHTCALDTDGAILCWGRGDSGQLARNVAVSAVPTAVSGLGVQAHLASGSDHACALGVDGVARCWGSDSSGQLGDAATHPSCPADSSCSFAPVTVDLADVSWIAAGGSATCAVYDGGRVACWGLYAGEGGVGMSGGYIDSTPATAPSITDATVVATSGHHQCVIRGPRSEVWCWGGNLRGEVGLPFPAVIDFSDPSILIDAPTRVPSPR